MILNELEFNNNNTSIGFFQKQILQNMAAKARLPW